MSTISQMFRFLLGRRQPPPPPVYYSRSTYGTAANGTYAVSTGAKFVKG